MKLSYESLWCNFSNSNVRTGFDFKLTHLDRVQGKAEDWTALQGLEI